MEGLTSSNKFGEINSLIKELQEDLTDEFYLQKIVVAAENNRLIVNPQKFNSLGLFLEIINTFQDKEISKDKYIKIDYNADYGLLVSDTALVRRVIIYMVINALEALQLGDTVTLDCKLRRKYIEFLVNNPSFMTEEIQKKVFTKYFSTKHAHKGLGTYSMKLLSERYLDGRVTFSSTKKTGTTFKVIYPLQL